MILENALAKKLFIVPQRMYGGAGKANQNKIIINKESMISKLIRSDVTNLFPHIMGLIRKIARNKNNDKHKNHLK